MPTEASLLPLRTEPEYDTAPMTVPLRGAGTVIDALGSQTSRSILSSLSQEPMAISEIAETVGTSMQNVRYHTTKLGDAGVVKDIDTWYSEKGREMSVYVSSCDHILLTLDDDVGDVC